MLLKSGVHLRDFAGKGNKRTRSSLRRNQQSAAFFIRCPELLHNFCGTASTSGKPFVNLLDTDAAWAVVREFDERHHFEAPGILFVDSVYGKCYEAYDERQPEIQSQVLVELLQLIERSSGVC